MQTLLQFACEANLLNAFGDFINKYITQSEDDKISLAFAELFLYLVLF